MIRDQASMTIFYRILYLLATMNAVDKKTLFLLTRSPSPIHHQLKKLSRMGLIREEQYTIKKGKKQKTVDYILLTVDGVRYIRDHCTKVFPWAEYLPLDLSGLMILGESLGKDRIVQRYTKMTTAAIMTANIGAENTACYIADPRAEKFTLGAVIQAAMSDYARAQAMPMDEKERLTFYGSDAIKEAVSEYSGKNNISADVRAGRYSGYINGPARDVLIYVSPELSSLQWYRAVCEREKTAYVLTRRIYKTRPESDERNAVLLVQTPEQFARDFRPAAGAGKASKDTFDIGTGFHSFWAVPISYDGIADLREIVAGDVAERREKMVDDLLMTGNYELNRGTNSALFPLIDGSGIRIAVEPILDIRRLKEIEAACRKGGWDDYAITCLKRHSPYIEAALPSIEIRFWETEKEDMVLF